MSEAATEELLCVWVEAVNDDGTVAHGYGYGESTDEAVQDAIIGIIEYTHDTSYVMNEWRAA